MERMIYFRSSTNDQAIASRTNMKTTLRRFRFDRGELSQQQLADMVSVSRQTIVSIERGDYAPSVKLALLLAEKLGTTVETIFILEEKDHE
jgi:putative transcriptional regulator